MTRIRFLPRILGLLLMAILAGAQNVNIGPPQEIPSSKPADTRKIQLDSAQLQREAKELADPAASIPADVEQINRGLLAKEIAEKLKRIESPSKRLRREVTQF